MDQQENTPGTVPIQDISEPVSTPQTTSVATTDTVVTPNPALEPPKTNTQISAPETPSALWERILAFIFKPFGTKR